MLMCCVRYARLVLLVLLLVAPLRASATTYYVDNETGNDANDGLSPSSAFATINKASSLAVQPGDTVIIHGGSTDYHEEIAPKASGTPAAPIVFQGDPAGPPRISNDGSLVSCVYFAGSRLLHDVVVNNIECYADVFTPFDIFVRLQSASYDEISDCWFHGRVTSSGIILHTTASYGPGSHDRILRNQIDPTGPEANDITGGGIETIQIMPGFDHNLIADNTISDGGHDVIQIQSSYNVIRSNDLMNPNWRVISIAPMDGDPAERNVIEGNTMHGSLSVAESEPLNQIQVWSPRNIFRYNLVYDNVGNGIKVTRPNQGSSAPDIRDNRIYHNVFYRNGMGSIYTLEGFQLDVRDFAGNASGNALVNNVFLQNEDASALQIWIRGAYADGHENTRITGNLVREDSPGEDVMTIESPPTCEDSSSPPSSPAPIAAWEGCYPSLMSGNLEDDPAFADIDNRDFHLTAGSPLRNAGVFLTQAVGSGTGTDLPVADASYFSDGSEVDPGDPIRLEDGSVANIVSIDYANNVLTLDTALTWYDGEGVHTAFAEGAPDVGAFEYIPSSHACGLGFELAPVLGLLLLARRRRPRAA